MKQLITLIFALVLVACKAQLPPGEYTSKNKKAIALFESALKSYDARQDARAIEDLTKAIEKDPAFIEPHLLLAQIYTEARTIQKALDEYNKALAINPKFDKKVYYNMANLEMSIGKYIDAKRDYETFLKYQTVNPDSRDIAERQLLNADFAIEAMKKPVPFDPKNMGQAINSPLDEYFPAVTADEQTFLFTRNNRSPEKDLQEDFLISRKGDDGQWGMASLIGNNINTSGNEGAPSLSTDGQLLFYVACQDDLNGGYGGNRKGYGSCDIFYTQKVGDNWSRAYNMGSGINTKFFESQPSFSADGQTLFFVSARQGGIGNTDIYFSTLRSDGSWGAPVNLGPKVNTPGKEESVFIHPDGKTLYFGSDGHVGMGGLDLFVTRMDEKGQWSTPVNLGYPINTYADENSILVASSGKLAFMASSREGGLGGLDLYSFDLHQAAQPGKVTYVKGKVYDANTKAPLGAHFELIDLSTGKVAIASDANTGNGQFLVSLPADRDYALNVSHPGYLFYSERFALKTLTDVTKPFQMDVPLQPIDTGAIVELRNVFFETAKFDLKPESKAELDKLIAFLKANPAIKGELAGHTDNVGDKKMNQVLSQNRAKAVYDFLVAGGIEAKRLTFKGYGDTKPKVKNDSDENRAINRRTEFRITSSK
jgi:outer membrane protein OmpA-like peptidoglycan-associated protein/tetratricopeptide (TPR) repeat protein